MRARRLVTWIAAALAIAIGAGIALAGIAYQRFVAPGPADQPITVVVPRGSSVTAIADQLAAAGVIEDAGLFRLGVRVYGESRPLQAGEYLFPAGVSARGAMEQMIEGRRVQRRVTIAEGLSNREIVAVLEATPALAGPLPEATTLGAQGQLLPETYFFALGDQRSEILNRMRQAMSATIEELWPSRDEGLPFASPQEAVVLASIVEKETGLDSERPRIAAVFINRLRKGMPLQSDPTVIFALTKGLEPLGRALTTADLRAESEFNTYVVAGLPPAPISNPGRAALEAVLHPATTEELYFVADGTGGHVFARTLAEHAKNVAAWRKISAERKTEAEPAP
jgi:UPF0755 protein